MAMGGGGGGGGMENGIDMMMMMPPPPSGMMPSGGNMGPGKKKMIMHMTLYWGDSAQILFSGWPGDRGVGMYLLALLLIFAASALLECISSLSNRLSRRLTTTGGGRRRFSTGLLLTTLHAFRMGLAYLVMLAVMSFNVGVLIAAVFGHALGFLLSGRSGIFTHQSGETRPSAKF